MRERERDRERRRDRERQKEREEERETKRERERERGRERERDNKYIFGHIKKIEVNRFSSKIVQNIKSILSVYYIPFDN